MWLHPPRSVRAPPSPIRSEVGNEAPYFGGSAHLHSVPHISQHVSRSPKRLPTIGKAQRSQEGNERQYVTASRESSEDSAFDPRNRRRYEGLGRKHLCLAFDPAGPSEAPDLQRLSSAWPHLPQQRSADILPKQDRGHSKGASGRQCSSSRTGSTLEYDSSLP